MKTLVSFLLVVFILAVWNFFSDMRPPPEPPPQPTADELKAHCEATTPEIIEWLKEQRAVYVDKHVPALPEDRDQHRVHLIAEIDKKIAEISATGYCDERSLKPNPIT